MTLEEELAVKAVIQETAKIALDEGIQTAVDMMRMAATLQPEMTVLQVAASIEATLSGK